MSFSLVCREWKISSRARWTPTTGLRIPAASSLHQGDQLGVWFTSPGLWGSSCGIDNRKTGSNSPGGRHSPRRANQNSPPPFLRLCLELKHTRNLQHNTPIEEPTFNLPILTQDRPHTCIEKPKYASESHSRVHWDHATIHRGAPKNLPCQGVDG